MPLSKDLKKKMQNNSTIDELSNQTRTGAKILKWENNINKKHKIKVRETSPKFNTWFKYLALTAFFFFAKIQGIQRTQETFYTRKPALAQNPQSKFHTGTSIERDSINSAGKEENVTNQIIF